jgi:hypothetical protein
MMHAEVADLGKGVVPFEKHFCTKADESGSFSR